MFDGVHGWDYHASEEIVRVDANHQLVGDALTFLIELVSIE